MTICFCDVVKRVEGMKELFLRALLAGDELDVVDQQDIDCCGSARGNSGCLS